jgi:hypothetical protein
MKSLKTLLFILFLGFQLSSAGQWREIDFNLPSNYDVDFVESQIIGFDTLAAAVQVFNNTSNSYINFFLLSTDNGDTWSTIGGNESREYYNFSVVYKISDSLYYSTNGGQNWSSRGLANSYNDNFYLLGDSSIVKHSGKDTLFYVSSNSGLSWDTLNMPNYVHTTSLALNFNARSLDTFSAVLVELAAPNNVRVNPYFVSTNNRGNTWDTLKIEHGSQYNGVSSFDGNHNKIYSFNDSALFYTGEQELHRLSLTTNQWDTSSFNPLAVPNIIDAYKESIVLACTLSNYFDYTIAMSRDNGNSWEWQKIKNGVSWPFGYLDDIHLYSDFYGNSSSRSGILLLYDERCPTNLIDYVTVCDSLFVDLSQYDYADSIKWDNGSTSFIDTIYDAGTHWVTLYLNGTCTVIDTFVILGNTKDVALADTSFCEEGIVLVDTGFTSYLWSTGASGTQETISTSGDYTVTVTDVNGCSTSDSFRVDIYSLPTLSLLDTFICPGDTAVLDGGDFAAHIWSTGVITRTIKASLLGDYFVLVTDSNGCETTDTAKVSSYPQNILTIGNDTALCGDSIVLDVSSYKPVVRSYTWSTGDTTDLVVFDQSGAYWLEVTDTNGCYARDTVNLTLHPTPSAPVIQRVSDTLYTSSRLIHQWYQDGNLLVGQSDSTLPSIAVGTYSVIVLDSNGCESDTSNLVLYTAGVSALLVDGGISAYPNPTNGGVTVRFKDISQNDIVRISVVSLHGQELDFTSVWEQDQLKLKWDIAPQPVWLVIQTTNGQYRKLLIER